MTTPSLTVAPAEDGDQLRDETMDLREALDRYGAGRSAYVSARIRLGMSRSDMSGEHSAGIAAIVADHASALSAERARVGAVEAALAAMTAERDRLTAEVARKDAALKEIAQHDYGLQGLHEDGATAESIEQYLILQVDRRRKLARRALTPITDGETDA